MKKLSPFIKQLPLILLIGFAAYRLVPNYLNMSKLEGTKAPHFIGQTLGPESIDSREFESERKLLIFWATWCTPCKVELSRIQALIEEGDIDAQSIIAISSREDKNLLLTTAKKRGYTFPIVSDPSGEISDSFGVTAVPTLIYKNNLNQIEKITSGISPLLSFSVKRFLK